MTVDQLMANLEEQPPFEVVPGITLLKIADRIAVKAVAQCLGLWDTFSGDLGTAKTLSLSSRPGAGRRIVTAGQAPELVQSLMAWMVLSARYKNGDLEWCNAVLVLADGPDLESKGREIASKLAKEFLV